MAVSRRVLMIAFHYPPETSSGVHRVRGFERFLPAYDWTPFVLTADEKVYETVNNEDNAQQTRGVSRARCFDARRLFGFNGRYPASLAVPDRYWSWLPFAVYKGLKLVREKGIDVLFSTSPVPTAHLIARAIKSRTGLPWVADFRDPWPRQFPGTPPSPFLRLNDHLETSVMRTADRIVANTAQMRNAFLERFPFLQRRAVDVVYNGFAEADFRDLAPASAAPSDPVEITHIGTVYPGFRDPQPVLDAMRLLFDSERIPRHKLRLTFVGGGSFVAEPEFGERLASSGLSNSVRIVRRVAHREALRYALKSDILLILQYTPDLATQLPAKIFEYMRAQKPILAIVSPGETQKFVVKHGVGVAVDHGNTRALSDAIYSLYTSLGSSPQYQAAPELLRRFERKTLTGQLAGVLSELSQRNTTARPAARHAPTSGSS